MVLRAIFTNELLYGYQWSLLFFLTFNILIWEIKKSKICLLLSNFYLAQNQYFFFSTSSWVNVSLIVNFKIIYFVFVKNIIILKFTVTALKISLLAD